jgi:16S rRNA (cytidine1402-2'-O)-methyltransferase
MNLKAGLYIVATPIGNLKDITFRAIETLQASSHILCEDTRITKILLQKYDIRAKLIIYNDHSTQLERDKVLALINRGEIVSLVSDAGTPLISDPGYKLVTYLQQNDCLIDVLPGPSSVISALCLSGMPSDRFMFLGFAPKALGEKTTFFQNVANVDATLICFETAPRVLETIKIAFNILGNRLCSVVREITKIHQEVIKDTLENLIILLENRTLRGEVVILIEKGMQHSFEEGEILAKLQLLVKSGLSKSESAKIIATLFSLNKTEVYDLTKVLRP